MKKNWFLYTISVIVFIIVFLVITLSGEYLEKQFYSNHFDMVPINNILSLEKIPIDDNNDNNDNGKKDDPVIFTYTEDKTNGNYIRLVNQFPLRDEIGKSLEGEYKEFNFQLNMNTRAKGVKYYITVEKLINSDFDENYVKIYLDNEGVLLPECIRETGRIKTFNEYEVYNGQNTERIIYKGVVTPAEAARGYKKFTFKMWVSEDLVKHNEDYLSQTFLARINVHATGAL